MPPVCIALQWDVSTNDKILYIIKKSEVEKIRRVAVHCNNRNRRYENNISSAGFDFAHQQVGTMVSYHRRTRLLDDDDDPFLHCSCSGFVPYPPIYVVYYLHLPIYQRLYPTAPSHYSHLLLFDELMHIPTRGIAVENDLGTDGGELMTTTTFRYPPQYVYPIICYAGLT